MTDLRKAAEMALEALDALFVGDLWIEISKHERHIVDDAIQALRQALAQPEQRKYITKVLVDGTFTTEPVTCTYPKCETTGGCNGPCSKPLYTAPPKRDSLSWVGLTDEEIDWMTRGNNYPGTVPGASRFARAIEAKLKEKNGG